MQWHIFSSLSLPSVAPESDTPTHACAFLELSTSARFLFLTKKTQNLHIVLSEGKCDNHFERTLCSLLTPRHQHSPFITRSTRVHSATLVGNLLKPAFFRMMVMFASCGEEKGEPEAPSAGMSCPPRPRSLPLVTAVLLALPAAPIHPSIRRGMNCNATGTNERNCFCELTSWLACASLVGIDTAQNTITKLRHSGGGEGEELLRSSQPRVVIV